MDLKLFKGLLFLSTTLFITVSTLSQTARPVRQGSSSRALGINPKPSSSGVDFQCPEEFGYYPHPSDCSQYYVCVFGGALLESCTGGLMYSNELQTCDWPRNVGCEVAEITAPSAPAAARESPRAQPQTSRVRFSSVPSGPSGPSGPSAPARIQQISSSQVYPPPPEPLRVAPNPVITTRGQPRNLPHQEDIAKLYAEAHDTLPPIREDEETDTQQRVYRGQPSTVTQVQRDRDGILHQPSINAIPTQTKGGSFAYVPQVQNFRNIDSNDLDDETSTILDRRKRDTTDDTKNDKVDEIPEEEILETSADGDSVRKARQLLLSSWQGRDHNNNNNFRSIEYAPSKHNSYLGFEPFSSPKPPVYAALYKSSGSSNRYYPPDRDESYSGYQKQKKYESDFKPISNLRPVYESDESKGELSPFRQYKTTARPPLVTPLFPVVYTSSNGAPPKKPPAYNYNVKETYPTTTPSDSSEETIPDNFSFFHFRPSPKPQKQVKPTPISFFSSSTPKNPFLAFQAIANYFSPSAKQTSNAKPESAFRASPRRPDDNNSQEFKPHIPKPTILVPVSGKHGNYAPQVQVTTSRPTSSAPVQTFAPKAPVTYSYHLVPSENYQKQKETPTTKAPTTFIITKAIGHHYSLSPQIQVTTPSAKVTPAQYYTQKVPNLEAERFASGIKNTHLTQVNSKMIEKNAAGIGASIIKNATVVPVVHPSNNYIKYSTTVKPVTEDEYYDYYEDYEEPLTTVPLRSTTIPNRNVENNKKVVKPNIKLVQNEIPKYIRDNPIESNQEYEDSDEYYDEYEDEDDEYVPPSPNVNAYRPASETAAPRRITTTTSRPMRPSTPYGGLANEAYRQQTTSTTSRPPTTDRSSIPPIIKFPDDPFQNYKIGTFPRYLNKSTLRPYTVRHRIKPTIIPTEDHQTTFEQKHSKKLSTMQLSTTTPVIPTTTTRKTTRKIYTVRPNRGNLKWKQNKNGTDEKNRNNGRKVTAKGRLELDENYQNRVETSSPSSNSQQKTAYNKNYYNSSSNYNPSNYDSYYTVYDDDVELYRDTDYQPQPQYNQNKQTVSSTYRPTAVTPSTLSTQRESYATQRPQTTYHSSSPIYDYDDALVAQLEEDDRYTRPSSSSSRGHIRGNRLHNDVHNSITERPSYVSSTTVSTSTARSNKNNYFNNYNNSPKYSSTAYVTTPFSRISSPNAITTSAPAIVVRSRYISSSTTSTTTTQAPREYTFQENQRLNLAEQSSVNNLKTKQFNLTRAGPIINNNITQKVTTTTTTTSTTTLSPKNSQDSKHFHKLDDFVSLESEKNDQKLLNDNNKDIDDDHDDDEEELTLVAITPRKNHIIIPTSLPEKSLNNKTSVSLLNKNNTTPIPNDNSTSHPTSIPIYDTYYYDYEPFDENDEFDDDSETIIITQKRKPDTKDQPLVAPSRIIAHSFQTNQNLAGSGSEHVTVEELAEINKLSTTVPTVSSRLRYIPKETDKELTEEQKLKIKSHIITENEPETFKSVSVKASTVIEKPVVENEQNENEDYVDIPARRPRIFVRTSTTTTESTTTSTSTSTTPRTTSTSTFEPSTQKLVLRNRLQLTSDSNQYKQLDSKLISSFKDTNKDQSIRSYSNISHKDKDPTKIRTGVYKNSEVLEARKPEKVRRIINRLPEKLRFIEPTTFAYAPASKLKLIETHKNEPVSFEEDVTTPITRQTTSSTTTTTSTTTEPSTTKGVKISNINDKIELQDEPEPPYVINHNNYNTSNLNRFVESIQSFTSRGIVFKEALNRSFTPSYYTKAVVSPFDSLAAQKRGEKEKLRSSTVRTSINVTPLKPIIKGDLVPSRDGFIITSAPREINKVTTSTTTEPTTGARIKDIDEDLLLVTEQVWHETSTHASTTDSSMSATVSPVTEDQQSTKGIENQRGRYRPFLNYDSISYDTVDSTSTTQATHMRARNPIKKFTPPVIYSTTTDQPIIRKKLIRVRPTPGFRLKSTVSTTSEAFEVESSSESQVPQDFGLVAEPVLSSTESDPIEKEMPGVRQRLVFKPVDDESSIVSTSPKQEALIMPIGLMRKGLEQRVVQITERPRYFSGNKYETTQAVDTDRTTKRFRATVEMPEMRVPEHVTTGIVDSSSETPQDDDDDSSPENDRHIAQFVDPDQELVNGDESDEELDDYAFIETTPSDIVRTHDDITHRVKTSSSTTTTTTTTERPSIIRQTEDLTNVTTTQRQTTTMDLSPSTTHPRSMLPPRASRINNAIKTTIAAAGIPRRLKPATSYSKCSENSPFAKCNEIPSRTNNRNRGSDGATNSRGTHPPRARPTLKPAAGFVSKASEYIDIYRFPPTRPDALYPQPTPDKTAAKCRKDVCLLPDCFCGGKDVPGEIPVNQIPQIVLLTFDDSVNDLNKGLYSDLFERGRLNPNGCPITATFYVSHEWTDYSQVQNLYSEGHEMASHTVSHSFGEQFSVKKWAREVAGQREILSAYGGVKLEDVRGFRAPFLSIGGNKMFKMLHDFNFTYDSSMPVYENRPPSWPYTLDYKIFHDCMIPPCPTKSYPGVWEVPMVMWQDLNGGRCSMGDACSNPSDAENVEKMIMKNFERHYTTNRAPFGLFYHAAWFTQPHHKEGFIKFLDTINQMNDVYIVTNWQAIQWVRDPTPLSRMNSFQPFQCNYSDRPKRCNNPKVCNLWHKSGVRYMRTCQPCPEIYPWTGKSGIRSSRIDNDLEVADSTN